MKRLGNSLQGRQSGFDVWVFYPLRRVLQALVVQSQPSYTSQSAQYKSDRRFECEGNTFPRIQRPAADVVAFAGEIVQDDIGIVRHVDMACDFRAKKNDWVV